MKWVLIWLNISWLGPTVYNTEEGCLETGKNAAIGLKHIFKHMNDEDVKFKCVRADPADLK